MITTLGEIRAALGSALESVEGLQVHDRLGGPYTPPCAVLQFPGTEAYRDTFGRAGTIRLPFVVTVWVGRADDFVAQTSLDEFTDWAGDLSVPAALERAKGAIASEVYVESFRLVTPTVEGGDMLGIDFGGFVLAARER